MAKPIKIAIIEFPGLNTEYETRREVNRAGMQGEFFRWNSPASKLSGYDGYIIGGGFSYEDRGRAGVIASLDPIMDKIKIEAGKGKPVLGICNGAQILLETGLIPGVDGNKLAMALACNKRIKDNEVLGTGYYNTWVNLKCATQKGNCMFTWNMEQGEIVQAPIAHAEGRFSTEYSELMQTLAEKGQLVFRYCDKNGVIMDQFPINPNGAMFNAAAICNPAGNVMAVMPHLERDTNASHKLFTSMRDAIIANGAKKRTHHIHIKPLSVFPLPAWKPLNKSMQMFVSLIINDNEAETHEMALGRLGFPRVGLKRNTHFEIGCKAKRDLQKIVKKLIQSGVLLNTNKESAKVVFPKETLYFDPKKQNFLPVASGQQEENTITFRLLVREKSDFVGQSKLGTIQNRLKLPEFIGLNTGVVWDLTIPTKSKNVARETLRKILSTNLFFNPHRQEAFLI